MQELLRHSSLRSTIDIFTQAVTPANHAAQTALLSLPFPPTRTAMFSPRSKRWQPIGLSHRRFEAMDLKVQKGYRIVFLLRPRMQGETICFYLISFRVPDGI